ncbi:MAG: hypothetical protein J1E34_00925 [Oscillospiraceae bacterium]|nr:hypothetical protein [Oscillospiraceae bacterium]
MLFGLSAATATTLTVVANILVPVGGALIALQPIMDAAKKKSAEKKDR